MSQTATTLLQSKFLHSASIAVVYRGKEFVLHQGELEAGKANPPNNTTLYEIGSVSKTFPACYWRRLSLMGRRRSTIPYKST